MHSSLFREGAQGKSLIENDKVSAIDLVALGETTRCEFKSTLRLNLHTNEHDKKMEHSCLKTIAAFLNSHGGYLLVGVNDDGVALGLEKDGFPNEDKMNLHLVNLLKQRLGAEHLVHVEPRFETFADKRVLVVKCQPSNLPVFLNDGSTGVLSIWHVTTQGERSETRNQMLTLAVDGEGQRIPSWEKQADRLFQLDPVPSNREPQLELLTETLEPMIQRELVHRGLLAENRGYDARLVGWVEVV